MLHALGTVATGTAGSPAPAAQKLHRHALECVFAFCSRAEMAAVSAVSRDWQSATLSMAPLSWRLKSCGSQRLEQVCRCPLRRHVGTLGIKANFTNSPNCLLLVSQRMPHLRRLAVIVRLPLRSGVALQFPVGLRSLDLRLRFKSPKDASEGVELAASFFTALDVVASLAHLEALTLSHDAPPGDWAIPGSLGALARARSLRCLNLTLNGWGVPCLSDSHIAELRALNQLQMVAFSQVDTPLLNRLLAPPHALRWQELRDLWQLTEDMAALLPSLPLHTLDTNLAMAHADFLLQLPQLTILKLGSAGRGSPDVERVLQAVSTCVQLRELTLQRVDGDLHFKSAQLSVCLARLSKLQRLEISAATELTTLEFLAAGSLPRTLTALELGVHALHTQQTTGGAVKTAPTKGAGPKRTKECSFSCPQPGHVAMHRAGFQGVSNGCGPEGFRIHSRWHENCCEAHDLCYSTCGKSRALCDQKFASCLKRKCAAFSQPHQSKEKKDCTSQANLFSSATQALGCQAYLDAQAEACECNPAKKVEEAMKQGAKRVADAANVGIDALREKKDEL